MHDTRQHLKTIPKLSLTPMKDLTDSYGCISTSGLMNKRAMKQESRSQMKQTMKEQLRNKMIQLQNNRLMTKIMQIRHRKFKHTPVNLLTTSKNKINPERQRNILIENQRLGRSLVMIKSGKTIERIKTQIIKSILNQPHATSAVRPSTQQAQSSNLFLQLSTYNQDIHTDSSLLQSKTNKTIDIDSIKKSRRKRE